MSKETPWGRADNQEQMGEGIVFYSTPSHGGYFVPMELYKTMPENLKKCSFSGNNWFEEDCSWCAVAIHWPHLFPAHVVDAAKATYNAYYANKLPLSDMKQASKAGV